MRNHFRFVLFVIFLVFSVLGVNAVAAPAALTYQGRIVKSDGSPLEASNVSFQFELVGPNGSCILYREQVNGIDMRNSNGMFDIKIGASHSYPALPSKTLFDSLDNSKPLTCEGGVVFSPTPQDGRILRVQFFDGGAWKLISPDTVIRSVPYAGFSTSSAKLQGHEAAEFILKTDVNSNASCGSGSFLTWDAGTQTFGCATPVGGGGGGAGTVTGVTSTNSYITVANGTTTPQITLNVGTIAHTVAAGNDPRIVNALQSGAVAGGDLSGTYPNPSVTKISNVDVSFTALSSGQILKYNGSAWVNSGLSTTDISGMSAYLTQSAFSAAIAPAASCTASQTMYWSSVSGAFACQNISIAFSDISGSLPLSKIPQSGATSGQILKWNGTAWAPGNDEVGSAGGPGTVTSVSGSGSVSVANGTTTPVISIATANTTTSGALSSTDWNSFNAKLGNALTSGQVFVGNASNVAVGRTLKISDIKSTVSGNWFLPTGACASGQTLSYDSSSDSLSCQTYSITSSQVTAALGFTPASFPSQTGQTGKILQTNGTSVSWIDIPSGGGSGTVTSVSGSGPISVATGTTTPVISVATANTTTTGVLSSSDWNAFNGKLGTTLGSGQVFVGDGSNVAAARTLKVTDIKSTVSGNWFLPTGACASGLTLTYLSASDTLSCQAYSLTSSQVTGALGYTPPSSAVTSVATGSGLTGGTITGSGTISVAAGGITSSHIADGTIVDADVGGVGAAKISGTLVNRLGLSANGFQVATKDDITTRTDSGFFQTSTATTGEGWPTTTNGWYHLISNTHSNDGNYYSMQFAGHFDNSNEVYYRSTAGSGTAGWNRLWHSGNLTNLNQLSNGPGYITGVNSSMVTSALGYTPLPQNSGSGLTVGYNGAGGPQVMGVGNGASMISFHRPGSYGVNFGLDTDNVLKVGGWSMGGPFTMWHSGNFNPASKLTLDAWNGSSYVSADGRFYGTIMYDTNNTGFYTDPSGISIMNDVRASIFYDRDNTGYYVDPNGTSNFNNVHGSNFYLGYLGDWISNRLGQDVRAGVNVNFGNVWLNSWGGWITDFFMSKHVDTWHSSLEGVPRFLFANGGTTYIRGYGDPIVVFRNQGDASAARIRQGGTYETLSDRRTKSHIVDAPDVGLTQVLALRPRRYIRNGMTEVELGWIAQEVNEALPEAAPAPPRKEDYYGVQTDKIVVATVGAIKELNTKILDLSATTEELKMMCVDPSEQKKITRRVASLEEENSRLAQENMDLKKRVESLEADTKIIKEKLGIK